MNNDETIIRQLIRRFMEGETTPEENDKIAAWFKAHPDVSDDLRDYQAMFGYFEAGMPWDFAVSTLGEERNEKLPVKKKPRLLYPLWISIAASVALVVLLSYPYSSNKVSDKPLAVIAKSDTVTSTPSTSTVDVPSGKEKKMHEMPTLQLKEKQPTNTRQPNRYRKHLFDIAPPKMDLAKATSVESQVATIASSASAVDSLSYKHLLMSGDVNEFAKLADKMADQVLADMMARQEMMISSLFEEAEQGE